nr:immunoglobulin heavy chain junction region [Mus musculus]
CARSAFWYHYYYAMDYW